MPEHAISTANERDWLSGRTTFITGVPETTDIHEFTPKRLANEFAISVLPTLSNAPAILRISIGGGVRNARKIIGRIA